MRAVAVDEDGAVVLVLELVAPAEHGGQHRVLVAGQRRRGRGERHAAHVQLDTVLCQSRTLDESQREKRTRSEQLVCCTACLSILWLRPNQYKYLSTKHGFHEVCVGG